MTLSPATKWQQTLAPGVSLVFTHKSAEQGFFNELSHALNHPRMKDFFVGGSEPSFSECDGEGDQCLLFALAVGSLRLTTAPPATTCFPVEHHSHGRVKC